MRRLLFPLLLGLVGTAVLVALGIWQLQRLSWKESVIARIEAAIAAPPVALPPVAAAEDYLAVIAEGRIEGPTIRFVHSGAEELVVAALDTGSRRVLVDLGLAPARAALPLPAAPGRITGNLESPQGSGAGLRLDEPNARPARDLDAMAAALGTEPILLVARQVEPPLPGVTPLPVGTEDIPNNHLGYAIQWFGLALVWAGMSVYLLLRARDPDAGSPGRPDFEEIP